jgi:hypothetical protein
VEALASHPGCRASNYAVAPDHAADADLAGIFGERQDDVGVSGGARVAPKEPPDLSSGNRVGISSSSVKLEWGHDHRNDLDGS